MKVVPPTSAVASQCCGLRSSLARTCDAVSGSDHAHAATREADAWQSPGVTTWPRRF